MVARSRIPLLVAAAGALGLPMVWGLAYHVGAAQRLDARGFEAAQARTFPWISHVGDLLAVPIFPPLYVLLCVGAVVWARRRGPAHAVAAGFLLVGTNVVCQLLKAATAVPRPWSLTSWGSVVDPVSWPSGHSTASAALVVALVIAAPAARRTTVAVVGGAWAVALAVAVVAMGWHMPSDALGAWCLVASVAGAAVAGLRAWEARPARAGRLAPQPS